MPTDKVPVIVKEKEDKIMKGVNYGEAEINKKIREECVIRKIPYCPTLGANS
jgi:hypothetical protein